MNRNNAFLTLMCAAAVLISLPGCKPRQNAKNIEMYAQLNPQNDFTLTDQDGKLFHLKDHRGQVVLLFFGYISCPDICPMTISRLSRVYDLLGEKRQKVLTVFVTIDPERDTPERIKEYLSYFKLKTVGLTGTKEEIDRVVNAYKASYQKVEMDSAAGYLMDHSDYVYLIDGQGRVNALIHTDDQVGKIAGLIKEVL